VSGRAFLAVFFAATCMAACGNDATGGGPVGSGGALGTGGTPAMAGGSAAGQTVEVLNDTFLSNNVTTDDDNAVYAAWIDESDRLPHLSVSKDHGDTWSAPIVLGAPGVEFAKYVNVKATEPGYVAVEYWGTPDRAGLPDTDGYLKSDGRRYDGYLAVIMAP
jgi:hypothetical protein